MKTEEETIDVSEFERFHVTGVDRANQRFKIVTGNASYAFAINVWHGSVWGVRPDGTRKKLREVYN